MSDRRTHERLERRGRTAAGGVACTVVLGLAALAIGCQPEVGSEAWCAKMKETPKADWSANQAVDYGKHCIFQQ